tara:strand:- start:487 stop:675 length:189 start_codon:yes stop_codon:yes gene_type:complete
MKCFEQDVDIENKLKSAIFAIDDIFDSVYADTDNKMILKRELKKVLLILEDKLRMLQDGELD